MIDEEQERLGGAELWGVDGRQLMDKVAGTQIMDDNLVRGFVRELEIAVAEGYLTCRVENNAQHLRDTYPYSYIQQVRNFGLTTKGQDRARGIRVVQPLPNPEDDDGRAIPALVLQQVAEAIAEEYTPEQVLVFLGEEGGIPLDRLPLPQAAPDVEGDPSGFVRAVLISLDQWGSEGRRILRTFVGSWLDDRMISGPTDDLRAELVEKLARRGWYVVDGKPDRRRTGQG